MEKERHISNVIPANFSPEFMSQLVQSLRDYGPDYVFDYAVARGQDPVFMKAIIKKALRIHWGKK